MADSRGLGGIRPRQVCWPLCVGPPSLKMGNRPNLPAPCFLAGRGRTPGRAPQLKQTTGAPCPGLLRAFPNLGGARLAPNTYVQNWGALVLAGGALSASSINARARSWVSPGLHFRRSNGTARPKLSPRYDKAKLLVACDVLAVIPAALLIDPRIAIASLAVAALVWQSWGLYGRRFHLSVLDDLPAIVLGFACATGPAMLIAGAVGTSGAETATLLCGLLITVVLFRTIAYQAINYLRRVGKFASPLLIVGAGRTAASLAHRIADRPEAGVRTIGFVDGRQHHKEMPCPHLGRVEDLPEVVKRHGVTDVVVGYGSMASFDLVSILRTCDRLDAEIHLLPRLFEMHRLVPGTDHIWGVPLIRVRRLTHRAVSWRIKRLIDVAGAGVALLVMAPLMAVIALAVRVEMGPGIIFRQTRVGLDGRSIEVRKFRSMSLTGPVTERPWAASQVESIGRVGRLMRKYSLDELPQIWNVLIGEMSLVGPRPERPQYVDEFLARVPRYADRHRVPVGLTGLAAVEGLRGDTSIADRAYFDNLYIENWSLWLDVKIILRTVAAVFRGTGE